jgi:hypothetical protein
MLTTTGGIYFTTNITERISVQSKALIGMSYGKTPFQLYQPTIFMIGPTYYKVTSAGDYGTAYKTGLSFQYQFNSNVAMGINANYTYTKFSFGFYGAQGQINYYQKRVSYLDLGLGLVVKL